MKRIVLACAAAAALGGCYKANIHLAEGPATASGANKFHFSLIGIIEISPKIDLQAACGGAQPVVIREKISFVGGLVNLVLGTYVPVFQVFTPSVDCGGGAAMPPPTETIPDEPGETEIPGGE